ncbi:hypothetical protein F4859DRAFT_501684 [Xylaria cf. heliscus]|nr:hypothetical protein F4859DRAFT_501684 [Xylaria cf. heliscus]
MGRPQHARRRGGPPGEGDPMDGVEYATVTAGGSGQQEQGGNGSPGDSSGVEEIERDPNAGWQALLQLDIDNPPLRDGGNATTIGFEFELLVAASRGQEILPDPHPKETRWLSDHLINRDEEGLAFKYTVRNKIIDQLNAGGVTAHKTEEYWTDDFAEDFEWWDSLEYDNPNGKEQIALNWVGSYQWDNLRTADNNVHVGVRVLRDQFVKYCRDNKIELYMVTQAVMRSIRDNLLFMVLGVSSSKDRRLIAEKWYESVRLLVRNQRQKHYSADSDNKDPNSVPLRMASDKYTAWSCTDDISIKDPMPTLEDYNIPAGTVPVIPNSDYIYPPELYKWFPAEVVSSVLDYDNPATLEALRTACETLRGELRIHKPMPTVRTGVHIHIGQQAGWTLLHLKKFATLWLLIEPAMYKLHREDRKSSIWCTPMVASCRLATLIFGRGRDPKYLATTTGPVRMAYQAQMDNYVPNVGRPKLREFFTNVWQYSNIRDLNAAMGSLGGQACIRWRIQGERQLSDETGPFSAIQTLEFRLMQGTLDAEHVWKWANSTAEQFRNTIQHLLDRRFPVLIGLNAADLAWFESRGASRQTDGHFTYPEPDGKVDWTDPFMIPGYRDTHDNSLNV